jgi:M3 family oligoendopeptidase
MSTQPTASYKFYPERPTPLTADFVRGEYASLEARIAGAEASESGDAWVALYADWNALRALVGGEGARRYHAFSRDMASADREEADRYWRQEVAPIAQLGESKILNALLASRHRDAIAARHGAHLIRALQAAVEPLAPVNATLRVEAGNLATDYSKLMAEAEVEINGERMTLPRAGSLMSSPDRDLRRAAFTASREWITEHRDILSGIYDDLVTTRHRMATNLGHENFIRLGYLGMGRIDYGPLDVERFRENVRRFAVPLYEKLNRRQAESLGLEALRPWDLGYDPEFSLPLGVVPIDSQLDRAERVFNALAPELGAHFVRMRDGDLIDLENRKSKRAGAYCTSFADEGKVAILCNSTGDSDDVRTLMHEMGHAFQKWESQPIEDVGLQRPTSDLAEVHSMGMEFLSLRHLDEFFDEENLAKFRRGRWKKAVSLICYVCVVDEFQHWVYANPTATPDERDAEWNRLWDIYHPGIDYTGVEQFKASRWYAQSHIFGMPFYYIDYALAETGAMQLGLIDAHDHATGLEKYVELCRIGGTESMLNVFAKTGLRSPFDEEVMRDLMAHASGELGIDVEVESEET